MNKSTMSIAVLSICFLFSMSYGGFEFTYNGLGAGGQMSIGVSDDHGTGLSFGIRGVMIVSLGTFGEVHYVPSLNFWFNRTGHERWEGQYRVEYDFYNRQTAINFGDIKYLFPIPKQLFFEPYTGIGFCIMVDGATEKTKTIPPNPVAPTTHRRSWNDGNVGFNWFFGAEFPVNEIFAPYLENRFSFGNNWMFRFTGGATFYF